MPARRVRRGEAMALTLLVGAHLVVLASGLLSPPLMRPATTTRRTATRAATRSYGSRVASCGLRMAECSWDTSFAALQDYKEQWGNADAPLNSALGRFCAAQRRLRATGRLPPERERFLEELGLSWTSPSDVDDPIATHDFEDMCARLEAYIAETGDAQVPKKYQRDPQLGGWVAACRRTRLQLDAEKVAALDRIGLEWVSTRKYAAPPARPPLDLETSSRFTFLCSPAFSLL